MPLFGPPNVKELKAKRNVKGLIKALGYQRDAGVRKSAAEALGELKDARAVEPIIAALKDTNDDVRQAAAEALGQIGDARAVFPLIVALEDEEERVRETAARVLARIGAPAVKQLVFALGYLGTQRAATEILEKIGAPAVEQLIAALKHEHRDVRQAAAEALGQIGDARAVFPLIVALEDKEERVRETAARVLARIGAPAVEQLVVALGNWRTQRAATEILEKIGAPAVEQLIVALKAKDSRIREATAEVLGKIGDARAMEPLVVSLMAGNRSAASALDELGWQPGKSLSGVVYWLAKGQWNRCVEIGAPTVELLVLALGNEDGEVRRGAAMALEKIGDTQAVEPLITALEDRYQGVCQAAAEALGEIGDERAVKPLIRVLMGVDLKTRKAAARALDKLGWQPDRSLAGVVYWLAKEQWDRCAEIGAPAMEPLIAIITHGEYLGYSGDARSTAAEALGQIRDVQAVEPLIAALGNEDKQVRCGAAMSLVSIYQSSELDDMQRCLILSQRDAIQSHSDGCLHTDTGWECHEDFWCHSDVGIGVGFPL